MIENVKVLIKMKSHLKISWNHKLLNHLKFLKIIQKIIRTINKMKSKIKIKISKTNLTLLLSIMKSQTISNKLNLVQIYLINLFKIKRNKIKIINQKHHLNKNNWMIRSNWTLNPLIPMIQFILIPNQKIISKLIKKYWDQ